MYQVLYRKWRPTTFADVSGQSHITTTLQNELKSGRINHAYLFTGSRGTGKTSCAKILAKAVNCLNPQNGNPCGKCEICKGIEENNILDVVEIDAASNNGVANIRSLQDEAAFTPAKAKYRVFIIDEVHMLSAGAFNALLKTLEEPPAHVIFILATTEVHKLPATILSRCQRFDFHRISTEDISNRLEYVAKEENVNLSHEASTLIASVSDGALRDSLSLLDRCISISTDVTLSLVRTAAGLADKKYLFDLTNALIAKDTATALTIIDSLYNQSKDIGRLADELAEHYRSLMLIKTMKDPKQLITLSLEEYNNATAQALKLTLPEIIYAMDTLKSSNVKADINKRFELEIAIIKLCSPELETNIESLITRISCLERLVKNGADTCVKGTTNKEQNNVEINNSPNNTEFTVDSPIESSVEDDSTYEYSFDQPPQEPTLGNAELSMRTGKTPTERIAETTLQNEKEQFKAEKEKEEPEMQFPQSPQKNGPVDFSKLIEKATPMENWQEVISALSLYSKVIAASFENTVAYVSGDYLLIDAKSDIPFKLLRQSSQRDKMRLAVKQITGKNYKLGPYKTTKTQIIKDDPLTDLSEKIKDSGINLTEL